MSDIHVKGLSDLQRLLDQLPVKLEKNVMRSALRAGAKVIAEEAKAHVPVKSGALRDSIRVGSSSRNGVVTGYVRVGNKKAWYARIIEYTGAAQHWIKPKSRKSLFLAGLMREVVDHPGMKPHPFMRPALDAKATEAIREVGNKIKARLTKAGLDASDVAVE